MNKKEYGKNFQQRAKDRDLTACRFCLLKPEAPCHHGEWKTPIKGRPNNLIEPHKFQPCGVIGSSEASDSRVTYTLKKRTQIAESNARAKERRDFIAAVKVSRAKKKA